MPYEIPPEFQLTVSGEKKDDDYPPKCPECGSQAYRDYPWLSFRTLSHFRDCKNRDYQPKPPQFKASEKGISIKRILQSLF